jgi:hypothetical protein
MATKKRSQRDRFSKFSLMAAPLASIPAASSIPAAATVATATAAVTTATAAVAAATSAATATAGSRFTGTRFIDGESTPFDGLSIDLGDRVLCVLFRAHRYERKAARFTSEFVLHQRDLLHRACLGEQLLQFIFRGIEGQIAYV